MSNKIENLTNKINQQNIVSQPNRTNDSVSSNDSISTTFLNGLIDNYKCPISKKLMTDPVYMKCCKKLIDRQSLINRTTCDCSEILPPFF